MRAVQVVGGPLRVQAVRRPRLDVGVRQDLLNRLRVLGVQRGQQPPSLGGRPSERA